jgi:hypothetical protein
LGQHRLAEDREFLKGRTASNNNEVAKGAAAGLLCSYGLDGFRERIWEAEKKIGYNSLPDHQRYYSAVFMCDAEVNNGGWAQYFLNSSGNQWKDAQAGLEAMGFKERLAIFKEAISLFGEAGPPEGRRARHDALSKAYKKKEAVFEKLDSSYYKCTEQVEVFAGRFVLENPDSFR